MYGSWFTNNFLYFRIRFLCWNDKFADFHVFVILIALVPGAWLPQYCISKFSIGESCHYLRFIWASLSGKLLHVPKSPLSNDCDFIIVWVMPIIYFMVLYSTEFSINGLNERGMQYFDSCSPLQCAYLSC